MKDILHRFSFAHAPIRGQWVRLDAVLAEVAERQSYPEGTAALLGEMLAAVAMIAEGIQFEGAVALQFRGSGPLTTVLAECRDDNALRGIARWPEQAAPPTEHRLRELLGNGHLAITLTRPAPNPADPPFSYQGLIELASDSLAEALESYFLNSEQVPTRLFFARAAESHGGVTTGLLLQRLPTADSAPELTQMQDDQVWQDVQRLAGRLDPDRLAGTTPAELLAETFTGHTITLHAPKPLRFHCSCSRERSTNTLRALPRDDLLELLEERGAINVSCEICGASYDYDAVDVHLLLGKDAPTLH